MEGAGSNKKNDNKPEGKRGGKHILCTRADGTKVLEEEEKKQNPKTKELRLKLTRT